MEGFGDDFDETFEINLCICIRLASESFLLHRSRSSSSLDTLDRVLPVARTKGKYKNMKPRITTYNSHTL